MQSPGFKWFIFKVLKWAELLIATGGALNPDKCYWYMVSYVCREGEWEYDDTKLYELTIILPDGTRKAIMQFHVMDSRKMMGVWSLPNGSDKKHLQEVVIGKTTKWVGKLKNSHLPVHLAWKAYRFQLWPGIWYNTVSWRWLHPCRMWMTYSTNWNSKCFLP
jgi:hypothetical protein